MITSAMEKNAGTCLPESYPLRMICCTARRIPQRSYCGGTLLSQRTLDAPVLPLIESLHREKPDKGASRKLALKTSLVAVETVHILAYSFEVN